MELDLLRILIFEIAKNFDFHKVANGLLVQITKTYIFIILILFNE